MELSQDLAHRSIVFIRFNPDEYQKDGTKIASCWCVNKKGLCVVKPTKKTEWAHRLHILGETIEYWLTHRTDKTIEIIQLFYDSI
jgi:predicted P-loop ATPase